MTSRKDDIVAAFDALKLAFRKHDHKPKPEEKPKPNDKPKTPTGFVGGFNPEYAPPVDSESYQNDLKPSSSLPPSNTTRPQFPVPGSHAVSSPGQGSPPKPSGAVPMPVPQSLTMQHALFLASGPSPNQIQIPNLIPVSAPPSRPHSASVLPNPHPPTSASPRPKPSDAPSRPRASSVPPTPTSPINKNQCEGITKSGKRCIRQVKDGPALNATHPDAVVERFCYQHSKEVLGPSGFYSRTGGEWIAFEDYIPDYLSDDTKVALRVEMDKVHSASDVPGYIYTFEIRDPKNPKVVHLKVGRAVNLVKRIDQWGKQCGSKEQVLRGWWPGTVVDDDSLADTSLMKGRVKAGEKGKWCHRLERLVHLELADLVVSGVYLESGFKVVNGGGGYDGSGSSSGKNGSPGKKGKDKLCPDCGTAHKEIFTFTRVEKGRYKGKEWELIVKPIIEKWGRFVNEHV